VIVSATALAELVLAVHEAAGQAGQAAARRWRYGNVVGIGRPRVRELTLTSVGAKYLVAGRAVAAITVTAHRRAAIDVVFTLDDAVASAQFYCATTRSEATTEQETAWAEHLATATRAALTIADVAATMLPRRPDATDRQAT
jgi:hypothetical protein